jgi:hypothetical protein
MRTSTVRFVDLSVRQAIVNDYRDTRIVPDNLMFSGE